MQMEHTELQAPSQNLINLFNIFQNQYHSKSFQGGCIAYSFAWIVNQYFLQVQVNRPIPETTISNLANSHEDTLLLLDLMRHKRQQEGQKKRVRKVTNTQMHKYN